MRFRLQTRDRLLKMGITDSSSCCICGTNQERHQRLFFRYRYSQECIFQVKQWLRISGPGSELQMMGWIHISYKGGAFKKKVIYAAIAATAYSMWRIRNEAFWNMRIQGLAKLYRKYKDWWRIESYRSLEKMRSHQF